MSVSLPILVPPSDNPPPTLLLPYLPTPNTSPTPWDPCPRSAELATLRQQVGYWKAMHQRACQREQALHLRVAEREAQLRLLRQQLFGRSSEARSRSNQLPADPAADTPPDTAPPPGHIRRRRGQQPGQPGHGRRDHSHLPATAEIRALPADQQSCTQCGQPFADFPGTDDTTLLEIAVQTHRRLIRRRRYRPTCAGGPIPASSRHRHRLG